MNRCATAAMAGLALAAPALMLASNSSILLAVLCGLTGNCAVYLIAHQSPIGQDV